MMVVETWYWVYAAVQTLLLLTCLTGAALYARWALVAHRFEPRPLLWLLLPFIAAMDIALTVDAGKWIMVRAFNTAHSVEMIQTVKQAQGYAEYAITRGFLLTIAALQVWPVWRVRKQNGRTLAAIFVGLVLLSIAAAGFHRQQIDSYCAESVVACRVK